MAVLEWDKTGERLYETGVDHGVLYIPNNVGEYDAGYAWNGLTAVTETPEGAEANPQYADNMKYLNLQSAEELTGTIAAFMSPPEFDQCDGSATPVPGLSISQQTRKSFGLSYRTRIGNDILADDYGYKLHLIWGALAQPSEREYNTVNETPEPTELSWEFSTTKVPVGPGYKPTSLITIDSTKVDADSLAALEEFLYGTSGASARLPLPAEVIEIFSGTVTTATPTKPTWNAGTHVITIPSVTGVKYTNAQTNATIPSGAMAALTSGQSILIRAVPLAGYKFAANIDSDWQYNYADA